MSEFVFDYKDIEAIAGLKHRSLDDFAFSEVSDNLESDLIYMLPDVYDLVEEAINKAKLN